MARPGVNRKLHNRRRKPARGSRNVRSRKVDAPIGGGVFGPKSREFRSKKQKGSRFLASLCSKRFEEGLGWRGGGYSLRMGVGCEDSACVDAGKFGLRVVTGSGKRVGSCVASFLKAAPVPPAAAFPVVDSGDGSCAVRVAQPAGFCKRRAGGDLELGCLGSDVAARQEGSCGPGKRRMMMLGGFATSSGVDRGPPTVQPGYTTASKAAESSRNSLLDCSMNLGPSGRSVGAGGAEHSEKRVFRGRLGFQGCAGTSSELSSKGPDSVSAAELTVPTASGAPSVAAAVPVIKPVGVGSDRLELTASIGLGVRDNQPVQQLSSSSGRQPERSEFCKEETEQTENQKKCIDIWLDSLPDMTPGAFLSPDDDYDNSPPSPVQTQEGNSIAGPATNPTPETSMQQISMFPMQITKKKPIVFVWDLDETLILATSLSTGQYAQFNEDLDAKKLAELGVNWSKASSYIAEKHLFSRQIRNADRTSLRALQCYDDGMNLSNYDFTSDLTSECFDGEEGMRKLAYRYRKITEFYKMGLENTSVGKYVPFWKDLWKRTDWYCNGWLSSVHKLLEDTLTTDRDVVHVIVTAGCLVPSLTKIMLFQLDKFFSAEHIFSSHSLADGKFDAFRVVQQHFGSECNYCAIGDGPYEELAAAENGWSFVRIGLSKGGLPTVGTSGGLDALGRYASTPMELTPQDLITSADAVTAARARDDVGLRFRESTRKQALKAGAGRMAR